jgi:hypothetical protein
LPSALHGSWVINFTPRLLYLRRVVGPRLSRLFWRRESLLSLPGFEPRAVQPMASSYADYASPASVFL